MWPKGGTPVTSILGKRQGKKASRRVSVADAQEDSRSSQQQHFTYQMATEFEAIEKEVVDCEQTVLEHIRTLTSIAAKQLLKLTKVDKLLEMQEVVEELRGAVSPAAMQASTMSREYIAATRKSLLKYNTILGFLKRWETLKLVKAWNKWYEVCEQLRMQEDALWSREGVMELRMRFNKKLIVDTFIFWRNLVTNEKAARVEEKKKQAANEQLLAGLQQRAARTRQLEQMLKEKDNEHENHIKALQTQQWDEIKHHEMVNESRRQQWDEEQKVLLEKLRADRQRAGQLQGQVELEKNRRKQDMDAIRENIVKRLLRRMALRQVRECMWLWADHAEDLRRFRRVFARLRSSFMLKCLREWAAAVQKKEHWRRVVRRVFARMHLALQDRAVLSWREHVDRMARRRGLLQKIVNRFQQRHVALAWEHWLRVIGGANRNRRRLMKAAKRMDNVLEAKVWTQWEAFVGEAKRLRAAATRLRARVNNNTLARAFTQWESVQRDAALRDHQRRDHEKQLTRWAMGRMRFYGVARVVATWRDVTAEHEHRRMAGRRMASAFTRALERKVMMTWRDKTRASVVADLDEIIEGYNIGHTFMVQIYHGMTGWCFKTWRYIAARLRRERVAGHLTMPAGVRLVLRILNRRLNAGFNTWADFTLVRRRLRHRQRGLIARLQKPRLGAAYNGWRLAVARAVEWRERLKAISLKLRHSHLYYCLHHWGRQTLSNKHSVLLEFISKNAARFARCSQAHELLSALVQALEAEQQTLKGREEALDCAARQRAARRCLDVVAWFLHIAMHPAAYEHVWGRSADQADEGLQAPAVEPSSSPLRGHSARKARPTAGYQSQRLVGVRLDLEPWGDGDGPEGAALAASPSTGRLPRSGLAGGPGTADKESLYMAGRPVGASLAARGPATPQQGERLAAEALVRQVREKGLSSTGTLRREPSDVGTTKVPSTADEAGGQEAGRGAGAEAAGRGGRFVRRYSMAQVDQALDDAGRLVAAEILRIRGGLDAAAEHVKEQRHQVHVLKDLHEHEHTVMVHNMRQKLVNFKSEEQDKLLGRLKRLCHQLNMPPPSPLLIDSELYTPPPTPSTHPDPTPYRSNEPWQYSERPRKMDIVAERASSPPRGASPEVDPGPQRRSESGRAASPSRSPAASAPAHARQVASARGRLGTPETDRQQRMDARGLIRDRGGTPGSARTSEGGTTYRSSSPQSARRFKPSDYSLGQDRPGASLSNIYPTSKANRIMSGRLPLKETARGAVEWSPIEM